MRVDVKTESAAHGSGKTRDKLSHAMAAWRRPPTLRLLVPAFYPTRTFDPLSLRSEDLVAMELQDHVLLLPKNSPH